MRILRFLSIVFVLCFSVSAFASNPADETSVKQTITSYLAGVDSRNPAAVGQALYTDAMVVSVNAISNKTIKISAADMVTRVKNGSLGGWKREVSFGNIDFNDKTAMAKVEITDSKVKQTSFVTLINDNGEWKIVSEVSVLNPNK